MSAPIDDLLYGGDDSGDEDEMNTTMRSFSGIPLTAAVAPPGGLLAPLPKPLTPPANATPILPHPQPLAPSPPAIAPSPKQSPGSGQQMFQQMFALLKQMLPVEHYATLHSEMRKGNGNDIKSIVDIIKRIAGDAIFSSVIQKMNLSRTFPPTNASGVVPAVKTEPGASNSSSGGLGRPVVARNKVTTIAPNTRPIAAAPSTLTATPVVMPATLARPTMLSLPATASVKPEPEITVTTNATLPAPTVANQQSRNEALEKILFAKRLLAHAATCILGHGMCQVKKCDDVRRVFKHSLSCGGTNGCSHCEQLKGLVKYHAKECAVSRSDHCSIPFCDGLRLTYAQNSSVGSNGRQSGGSEDEDDNTPLSSSVIKSKKPASGKSPQNRSPTILPLKRKNSTATLIRPASASASPAPLLSPNFGANMAFPTPSVAKPQQKNVTANMTQEYGRLLQLILHVEKCTTSACIIGEECVEAKTIMKQMSTPNPPARAKTYKQIYGHYKTCVAKNNTANCPMCKIGLLPILPASMSASSTVSPHLQAMKPLASTATTSAVSMPTSMVGALNKRPSTSVSPTPRSPLKKPRTIPPNRGKATAAEVAALSAAASEMVSQELAQASVADIRKEADVLTHTSIELGTERRIMTEGRVRMVEQLRCQKEAWVEKDLFNSEKLRMQIRDVSRRAGVELGSQSSDVMAYALHVYLKQVIEEMVEISKQRSDVQAQSLEALQKAQQMGTLMMSGRSGPMELTATDILRVSCEDSYTKLRQEDLMLRSQLLEDAKREEQIERERAKKRKKVDRSKLTQDERDEADMDIEELARKDLRERLLQQDKSGLLKVGGRVNESIATKYIQRPIDNQVTMEDASYWLMSQKPYIRPKLFVRAEAARIVTKSLL
ncbi:hypothetical protein CCR75_005409 [Bremia lactucae]|uniref:histone acetyltransferase n=1 Tax=Bremia lactucae TaxID=4779 RepID=A0A976IDW0_BRELC|nr:hypothetical protein CCR75_005409 [Bremia lactucae]